MASTVYPYAVTLRLEFEDFIERVQSFNVSDAMFQAVLQFNSSRNIAGKPYEGVRVVKIEPDFTLVERPMMDLGMRLPELKK